MNCLIFALLLLAHSWAGAGLERVASVCWAVLSAHSKGVERAPVRGASLSTLAGQPTESQTLGVWVPPATEGFPSADLPPADLDGNSKGDSRWAYEWDGENRLIKVTSQAGAVSAGAPYQMLTFRYDALGRLLERKEFGGSAAAPVLSNTTTYLYGGWKNLCTWKAVGAGASTLQATQVWGLSELGGGIEGLLFYKSAANGAHACAYDGGGNLTGLVALSNGTVSGQYEYDAFGTLLRQGGVSAVEAENPWRFSTKRMDPVSGLMHYEYRAYNPALGRWLSRDPIGENGGANLTGFVNNNAINFVDPHGLRVPRNLDELLRHFQDGVDALRQSVLWDLEAASSPSCSAERFKAASNSRGAAELAERIARENAIAGYYLALPNASFDESGNVALGYMLPRESSAPKFLGPLMGPPASEFESSLMQPDHPGWYGDNFDEMAGWLRGMGGAATDMTGNIADAVMSAQLAGSAVKFGIKFCAKAAPAAVAAKTTTPLQTMLDRVSTLDFRTPPNKAIFYSGPGQGVRATAFAERIGGMTIEMTSGGRALAADALFQSLSTTEQFLVWQRASRPFAEGACGQINAFIRGARPDRTFRSIEEPLLNANPNIYRSTYHY